MSQNSMSYFIKDLIALRRGLIDTSDLLPLLLFNGFYTRIVNGSSAEMDASLNALMDNKDDNCVHSRVWIRYQKYILYRY